MRNFLLLLAVIVTTAFTATNVSAQYCTTGLYTTAGCTDDDYINSFSTTGGVTNITNNNTGCNNTALDAYTYNSSMTHTTVQGSTVNFSITLSPAWTEGYKIWVDFNNDGDFDDVGELVVNPAATVAAGSPAQTGNFVVPVATVPGTKRMRVRCVFATATFGPCTTHGYGEIEDYNLQVVALTPCNGTPNAGTATSTITNILCPGANFTLGLSGSDLTSGLTYQWQSSLDNSNWSDIAGATSFNYTTTQVEPIKYYRAKVTCTNPGGSFSYSVSVAVTNGSGPTYAPLPFTESFENTWMNTCNTREIPNNSWRNTPGTGEASWRRNDDGGAAAWTTPATGAYTPAASAGTFSARFHSNNAPASATGRFDLHLNCATAATNKRILFDFINADGTDSIAIYVSTNAGTSFVRVDSAKNSTVWRKKAVVFASTSATTILRFIAYSDDGTSDIGIDNVKVTDFDNCTGTPVGGTASNNAPASVCAGIPFTLTVTGQTDANLLTYQWEVSTNGGASWTPIAGATAETFTTSQNTSSIYRLKITCNGGAFAYSTTTSVTSPPIPVGQYTINKNAATTWPGTLVNANFNSFAAAISAMSCGIGGAVTFNVVAGSGPYNEQVIITPILNTSATNTVTFNGNGETVSFATTNAERAVFKLKGADYIRIENMVINPTPTTNAYGIELYNNADSNILRNNTINLSTTATANSLAGIVIAGSETDPIGAGTTTALMDANQVLNNTINGGYYGITLTATFAGGANGNNLIKGNTIRDFYAYGIYVSASYNTIIDSNRINRPTRTNTNATVEGIYYPSQSNTNTISRNRITNPFGGFAAASTAAFNGITFTSASASAGNDNIIVNNLIAEINKTTGAINALNNSSSSSVSYFHNTISLDDIGVTATSATRGLNIAGTPSGVLFYDNMVSITRAGTGQKHGIYLGGGALILGSDYNNVYVSGTNAFFGFYTANRATLAAWKTATIAANLDAGSYSTNPVFLNPASGDYCAANAAIDNKGLYIGVDLDINGNTRNATTPDIGAFECTPPPCSIPPVTGATVVTPTSICENLPVALDLNIGAFGSGQTFTWEASTDGGLNYNAITPALQVPGTTITSTVTMLIRAKATCATASEYTNAVLLTVFPAFKGGTYTIDTTAAYTYVAGISGGNFKSFNTTVREMQTCGILGPVVFNVVAATGPYVEKVRIDSVRGTSVVNTVTYNGNANTITFDPLFPPTNTERAVIKLVRADHFRFNNLTIDASNGTSYGYGVQLFNNADSNSFRNNTIISSPVAASNLYSGVVINGSEAGAVTLGNTLCDSNSFVNNIIRGGFYGITVVGNSTAQIYNNVFQRNSVEDFYSAGIYVAGTSGTVVDSNTVTRPTRLASTAITGIFSTAAANDGLIISRNSIRNLAGANTAAGSPFSLQQYGIYHNIDQTTPSYVYNNLVSDLGGLGIIYGLYNVGSDNVHYYHNTLSLDSTAFAATGVTRGYYQQGQATGIEFKNNLITIKRGGNAVKNAVYLDNTTSGIAANYNDYFVSGSNAHIGYYPSANRTTLAQWQLALGGTQEANSLNVDPLYQNPAIMDYRPSITTVDNLGTNTTSIPVTTDIKGIFRSSPPDMGAFEFAPIPCTSPVAGTASVTPLSNICLQDPITLDITGHSQLGTLTFQWEASANGTSGWTPISPILYGPQFSTTITPLTYFRARVACGPNGVYTNVVHVTLNSVVMGGTYRIGYGATTWNGTPPVFNVNDNFATFTDAVNAMQCGITSAVLINVKTGTYNEQIRINNIRNTSAVNTVTFQAESGVAADAVLTFGSTAAGTNYTLKLDSTQYFTFRNLTIAATNASFGRAVEIANTASYDSLTRCIITSPAAVTTANSNSVVYANAVKGNNLIIKKNNITNGSNGIYFTGTSAAQQALPGHLIDSNTVSGSYHSGIVVQNANDMIISANTVNLSGTIGANAAGISTNRVDSGYRIQFNTVNISNATATVYGIYVQNSQSVIGDSGIIRSNRVIADQGNTGIVYGMTITGSKNLYVVNNTAAVNSSGATSAAYGFHSLTNTEVMNWYNNSAQVISGSTNGYAAYFNHAAGGTKVYNNIFANKGGGRAMYVNNPGNFLADYNMLYSAGANLIQTATGAPTNFTSLLQWKNTWNWDRHSLTGRPKFVSNTDLRPDVAQDSSWLMHGRGVQIVGNAYDFNGQYRPQTLTQGVPDLGAYEFHPTVLPTAMTAVPASPAPNTEQTFYYGSDTVMRIKWGATAPPAVDVRRFSGDVPPGLQTPPNSPRPDSMFFHTTVDIPAQPLSANKFPFEAKLYYVESWMGSIPEEYMIGLGRKLESNSYVVGYNSQVNLVTNEISQKSLNFFDIFTGLINPAAQKDSDDSTSNRGKDFWVGYQRYNAFSDGGTYEMVLYFGANNTEAHVKVEIEGTTGTPWVRNYTVPANSAIQSDNMPKTGADDARLIASGLYPKKGIHITSDVPIVAYAHEYSAANSGATMLIPTPVWGYEYFTLSSRQNYTNASNSAFHIVAKENNTWVEINPSNPTLSGWTKNGGTQPNGSYLIQMNKGDAFQVLGAIQTGAEGWDLTGSTVKSIANSNGQCFPIAVFAGSTRTGIGCGTSAGSSGDLILQQIFPYQAWGTKYATAPTSNSTGPNAGSNMVNIYRVLVKDPATQVKRNGVVIPVAQLINGRYYQFESGVGEYIESNKPILVAEYMSSNGACGNTGTDGDPEMFYLSPLQQAIKSTQLYRNQLQAINENFITLVIPTDGLTSLRIDGVNWQTYPVTDVFAYNHPNLPNYSIVSKRWAAGSGSSIVESDLPFTGIVYGLGSVESYGYNLGTLVRNLNNLSTVDNVLDPNIDFTGYTCKGAPFTIQVLLPVAPDSIRWHLSALPWFNPHVDSMQHAPVATGTITKDGILYYVYTLNQSFTSDSANNNGFVIPITYWSPELESCDKSRLGYVYVTVLPTPQTDFSVTYSGLNPQACEGDIATFKAQDVTANGVAVNQWSWTFHTGATATGQNQTFSYPTPGTYPVKLVGITGDGCISDTTKNIIVNPKPPVTVSAASVAICPGDNAVMSVASPLAGATYNWYNVATGGTILGSGTTFTATGVTPPASFWVEGVSSAGCKSVTRAKVDVTTLPLLAQPVVTVTGSTATTVTFSWSAVPGAASYQVSTNAGGTWTTPSSGATGTTHTVTGLGTLAQQCLLVRVLGTLPCQTNTSASVCGCTNSSAVVVTPVVSVCTGTSASFTIQSPGATITYNWYSAATGGTLLGTGTTFNSPAVTGTTNYYVEQVSLAGCTGSPRTQVTANILAPLATPNVPVPTGSNVTVNSITWTWTAVPGAASYQVSLDNGVTWITPSSGATGLSHTVGGLGPVVERCLMVRAIGTIACQTSQSAAVCAKTRPDNVFIPNTITPNGDGKNDVLVVYGWAIQNIQLMVFNQWGEKIHEINTSTMDGATTGGFTVWDGKYKGKVQPVGVYVYTTKITMKDGSIIEKSGPLNIVR